MSRADLVVQLEVKFGSKLSSKSSSKGRQQYNLNKRVNHPSHNYQTVM